MHPETLRAWASDAVDELRRLRDENERLQGSLDAQRLISDRAIAQAKELEARKPLPPAAEGYRLLRANVDIIRPDDEYLSDDTTRWEPAGQCIFVGMTHIHGLKPGRRRITGGSS